MRSPEKWGYSVGKLCPTAKLCMIAVFGPKSLYWALAIRRLPSLELNEANIIQDTRATYPAISSQSAMPEPFGRGRYKSVDRRTLVQASFGFTSLLFHFGQARTAFGRRLPGLRCAGVGANPKRAIFSVKRSTGLFLPADDHGCLLKNQRARSRKQS